MRIYMVDEDNVQGVSIEGHYIAVMRFLKEFESWRVQHVQEYPEGAKSRRNTND